MDFETALQRLAENPGADLDVAELAFLLARDEFPELDVEASLGEVAALAHDARHFVRGDFEARIQGLCRFLFHEMGFRGNVRDYYDPGNSYLNVVLERRTGIPISLGALTMALGSRLGLAVHGVGLPGHFVVKFADGDQERIVDCFHGGRVVEPYECGVLVQQATGKEFVPDADSLRPLPLGLILRRMLSNLRGIYLAQDDHARVLRVLERLRVLSPGEAVVERDLGIALMRLGRPGPASAHLERYLEADPGDAGLVRQLLAHARRQAAEMN